MIFIWLLLIITSPSEMQTIFDFKKDSDLTNWRIVDDRVMGGRSLGTFNLSPDGFGVFSGEISLDNYGGFSSVRHRFASLGVEPNAKIILTLKGDGKSYNFRVKDQSNRYYSYTTSFNTSGDWEKIELSLRDMYPTFRGRRLNQPNFSSTQLEEITFLYGNKKAESFQLLIDKIELQ